MGVKKHAVPFLSHSYSSSSRFLNPHFPPPCHPFPHPLPLSSSLSSAFASLLPYPLLPLPLLPSASKPPAAHSSLLRFRLIRVKKNQNKETWSRTSCPRLIKPPNRSTMAHPVIRALHSCTIHPSISTQSASAIANTHFSKTISGCGKQLCMSRKSSRTGD